jgi:hypothetical protein
MMINHEREGPGPTGFPSQDRVSGKMAFQQEVFDRMRAPVHDSGHLVYEIFSRETLL